MAFRYNIRFEVKLWPALFGKSVLSKISKTIGLLLNSKVSVIEQPFYQFYKSFAGPHHNYGDIT